MAVKEARPKAQWRSGQVVEEGIQYRGKHQFRVQIRERGRNLSKTCETLEKAREWKAETGGQSSFATGFRIPNSDSVNRDPAGTIKLRPGRAALVKTMEGKWVRLTVAEPLLKAYAKEMLNDAVARMRSQSPLGCWAWNAGAERITKQIVGWNKRIGCAERVIRL